jgi:hypothetical protein
MSVRGLKVQRSVIENWPPQSLEGLRTSFIRDAKLAQALEGLRTSFIRDAKLAQALEDLRVSFICDAKLAQALGLRTSFSCDAKLAQALKKDTVMCYCGLTFLFLCVGI